MNFKNKLYLFYFLILIIESNCQNNSNQEMTYDNIYAKVLGHSGKISLTNNNTSSENTIVINFASLQEKDSDGLEVGKSGSTKHSFNNFAQLDFTFSNILNTTFQNLNVLMLTMNASGLVNNDTKFEGVIYIFKQSGQISLGGNQTAKVNAGNIKFSIVINNWPFCDNSTDIISSCNTTSCCRKGSGYEKGSYLDFSLEIKSKNNSNKTNSYEYDYGTSSLILSSSVTLDGKLSEMPNNYPLVENKESSQIFTFRFSAFNNSAYYDPLIQFKSDQDNSNTIIFPIIAICLLCLAFIIFAVWVQNSN